MKGFNALLDNKLFFDHSVKNRREAYEKTTGTLFDYLYHQINYKLIFIDLSRQTNTRIPQQINFIGKLEEDEGGTMFFMTENQ